MHKVDVWMIMKVSCCDNLVQVRVRVSVRLTGFGLGLGWVCMLVLFQHVRLCIERVVTGAECVTIWNWDWGDE